ncbi:MAG TPA: CAP domain-containing protein [Candidatus Sulfotelmatobacter sp.]
MFVLAIMLGAVVGAHPFFFQTTPAVASDPEDKASAERPGLKKTAATAADIPFHGAPSHENDLQLQQHLLELANQDRARAGAPPLTLDDGLSRAARIHAEAMFDARQLSHQFNGEASLAQRLAASTKLQLDMEGENVALDYDAAGAELHLMHSPPHRENLLNPNYNVIGLGIVQSGDHLYVVQDFGHALPNYSAAEVKDRIAMAVAHSRRQSGRTPLTRQDLVHADAAACSMTQADKLSASPVHQLAQRYTVLSFTSLHPESLPDGADRAIGGPNLRSFSLGACYGKTETYPTGVYWIVLSLD